MAVAAVDPLVSLLIPCCGMLEYTKLCVPSVLQHTRPPFELIFLDIGSLDGTAEYLAGLAAGLAGRVRVEVVRTPTDLGIPTAVQMALGQAQGEYFVLLNNDTVVTDNWLRQLLALIGASPAMGMVGPMSNYAAPPQLVETVPYRIGPRRSPGHGRSSRVEARAAGGVSLLSSSHDLLDVNAVQLFARHYREQHATRWVEAERLGGFCLLLRREVYLKLGPLGDDAGLGIFDTDLLSLKVRQQGYRLAVCRDLFIHHFGTRTFAHGAPSTAEDKTTPVK